MSTRQCVKVIKILREKHSAFDHGEFTLEYAQNKWTYPSVGKIYAFKDLEHALDGRQSILVIPYGRLKLKSLKTAIV